jgi:hypothetical protein
MRRDEVSHGSPECPSCRACAWIDLADDDAVLALRELDAREALSRSPRRAVLRVFSVTMGSLLGAIGLAALAWHAIPYQGAKQLDESLVVVAGALVCIAYACWCARAIGNTVSAVRRRQTLPTRWRLAAPPDERTAHVVAKGAVRMTDQPLVAPISGRRCLAYEVGVRDDAHPDRAVGSWLLLEQRSAAAVVGEVEVATDSAWLVLRRTPVDRSSMTAVERFLRERGFLASDTALHVFESILPVDAEVQLRHDAHGHAQLAPADFDGRE